MTYENQVDYVIIASGRVLFLISHYLATNHVSYIMLGSHKRPLAYRFHAKTCPHQTAEVS